MEAGRSYPPRPLKGLFGEEASLPKKVGGIQVTGLTADSREVTQGMLFAALPGSKADGTAFIGQAVEKGARAILTGSAPLAEDPGIPVVRAPDPRRALALAAAAFFGKQPDKVVAVTGTSGKTSVAVFARQIFAHAGKKAASLGTIGLATSDGRTRPGLTTPDPVTLHRTLADLAHSGVTHLALEASSHGLDQRRLDGLKLVAGGFTNLSRDHLDYHKSVEDYLRAKMRLFDTLLPEGAVAVVDADQKQAAAVAQIAKRRGLVFSSVGTAGETLKLLSVTRMPDGARLLLDVEGEHKYVPLPLIGEFQVANALMAAALAMGAGLSADEALAALPELEGAPGRLELVGMHANGAKVFVDYAHKPGALTAALEALRPHTDHDLVVVFGAGGDRDPGKRALMGEAASLAADRVIVTDDNPRSEEPAAIRRAILDAAPHAIEIGDRREAIRTAISSLQPGDVLLVAGKGHETGQTVGNEVLPFSDQEEVRAVLAIEGEGK
ncbi:UDP-N-acetylmuramoyl-L-alanyl-D-glutamate--2,6-diaminopimelate ligase [Afifella sp. IM 167]|uniref:UDP-N-acetylmuramoyl-L-alanyl-D-glutamate--2, 6-diaminopimelate ligase n=1 Tax=Afifella sp. IM 167 TaxID=2033586 RepID=UPI001CCEB5F6|nr:UDP-N-acetylmuramoyl-L-alanyl-D-glutamate--2,6-diaminopimelate ligase [Afifella sp. IM 167]MBZ8131647.1 UDP-N-acetylmuramoyl-L-alanyl-D-glutamate--2,6-diaminopimelate ligase [Afifella sp. IM 167]